MEGGRVGGGWKEVREWKWGRVSGGGKVARREKEEQGRDRES